MSTEKLRDPIEAGFSVILLRPRSKAPVEDDWTSKPTLTFSELENRARRDSNFGVRPGRHSKVDGRYLHVLDVDIRKSEYEEEALEALDKLLPDLEWWTFPQVKSGSGGKSFHVYFLAKTAFKSRKLAKSDKKFVDSKGTSHFAWEIDLFGTGKQVVLPPSVHPDTGNRYKWRIPIDFEAGLPEIDDELLAELSAEDGAVERTASREPTGLSDDEIWDILDELVDWGFDRELWRDVGMALEHERGKDGWRFFDPWSKRCSEKYDRDENLAQWKSFKGRKHPNPKTLRTLLAEVRKRERLAYLEMMYAQNDEDDDTHANGKSRVTKKGKSNDPDMSILAQSRIPAPEFPIEIFGDRLAKEAEHWTNVTSAPIDFIAAGLLSTASTVIGNTTVVEIKKGFRQPAILWCQIIGPPSSKKTPALKVFTHILSNIEKRYEPFYSQRVQQWEREKDIAETKLKVWQAKIKARVAEGKEVEDEPPPDCRVPPAPKRRLFILNDATIEAFLLNQARCPRGFMTFRDELTGWLNNMERYHNGASERGIWLEAYDGGSYSLDRVKFDGHILKIPRLCSPILGGIQPERLMELVSTSVVDDGLQARFLPFWPDHKITKMSTVEGDDTWLTNVMQRLAEELSLQKNDDGEPEPYVVPFTTKAFEHYRKWRDRREEDEQYSPTRLLNVYGKADGLVGRLALVLEHLWWAAETTELDEIGPPETVSLKAVKAAIRFREEYLKPMQQRVYTQAIEAQEVTNARMIAQWIVDNEMEVVNARDIRRDAGLKGLNSRTPAEIVDAAMIVLTHLRWLEPKEKDGPGRPAKDYIVNQKIWELLK